MTFTSRQYVALSFIPVLLLGNSGLVNSKQLERRPYRIDAGSKNSALSESALLLAHDMKLDVESALGWTQPPDKAFLRMDLSRSRNAFTIDGVTGSSMELMVKLPSGKWWLTLWVEAGMEDSSTVSLDLAGEKRRMDWHSFQPPAEPRSNPQAIFRVYHGSANVSGDNLTISLSSPKNPVRLLGLTLTPDPQPVSVAHRPLLQQMVSAGKYGSTMQLQPLLETLHRKHQDDPFDAFSAYWSEQIGLLRDAEIHYEKRGWEFEKRASGLGIFDRFHQAVMILDGLLNHPEAGDNPFYQRALFLRGRLLYWLNKERGPNELAGGLRDLNELYQAYPEDKLLAMYNGEEIDEPDPCDDLVNVSGSPAWSVAQRELLCRMREIAHWWVREQQAPNGEFGGKIGDDVELLRWWMPLVLAGDTLSLQGWRRLADGVWETDNVYMGYSREATDVEHSSEFISDTAPGMVVYSDDPLYLERLRYSADYFVNLWTGQSRNGHRFFRSAWFSSTKVDETPPKNRDVEYNCRATKAVRYLAWKTGDQSLIKALLEWSLAWRDVAMSTTKGKPPGLIPASVRFPDEAINGDGSNWYEADMYWDYFDWAHNAGGMMLDQLLFTYTLTKDQRLLDPLLTTLEFLNSCRNRKTSPVERGSANWAATVLMESQAFWSVAAQWRLLSGDARFDDLLWQHGPPYLRYRLSGVEDHLVHELKNALQEVRFNTPLKTSEAIHTDRVYVPGYEHLKAMLTGDGSPEGLSPYIAVSWENTGEDFTALVVDADQNKISAQLFSQAEKDRDVTVRLWKLDLGDYRVKLSGAGGVLLRDNVKISKRGQRYSLSLPARKLINIEFEPDRIEIW